MRSGLLGARGCMARCEIYGLVYRTVTKVVWFGIEREAGDCG